MKNLLKLIEQLDSILISLNELDKYRALKLQASKRDTYGDSLDSQDAIRFGSAYARARHGDSSAQDYLRARDAARIVKLINASDIDSKKKGLSDCLALLVTISHRFPLISSANNYNEKLEQLDRQINSVDERLSSEYEKHKTDILENGKPEHAKARFYLETGYQSLGELVSLAKDLDNTFTMEPSKRQLKDSLSAYIKKVQVTYNEKFD